jgi:hypothetical protein
VPEPSGVRAARQVRGRPDTGLQQTRARTLHLAPPADQRADRRKPRLPATHPTRRRRRRTRDRQQVGPRLGAHRAALTPTASSPNPAADGRMRNNPLYVLKGGRTRADGAASPAGCVRQHFWAPCHGSALTAALGDTGRRLIVTVGALSNRPSRQRRQVQAGHTSAARTPRARRSNLRSQRPQLCSAGCRGPRTNVDQQVSGLLFRRTDRAS